MTLSRREREQLARREYIMDAARGIFAEKGYVLSTMNEIAKKSEFTKRTLYQYFEDKADLYLSVLIRDFTSMSEYFKDYNYKGGNGFEIMREVTYAFFEYYKSHRQLFRIIYDISKVKSVSDNSKIDEFETLSDSMRGSMVMVIEMGQKDGSITNVRDPMALALSFKYVITSFFNSLTVSGEGYVRKTPLTLEEFSENTIEMILETIRA